jgi:hypothetical protein
MRTVEEDIDYRIAPRGTNDVRVNGRRRSLLECPMPLDGPKNPPKKKKDEYAEVDYLMCGHCGTPCYVFEIDGSLILEALCMVCGNDEVRLFNLGEEAGPDDD